MKNAILLTLVAGQAGLLALVALTGGTTGERERAPAEPVSASDGTTLARLDQLAAALEQLTQREPEPPPATPAGDPALARELARMAETLEQLREELALARGEIARGPVAARVLPDLAYLRELYPATDWLAWDRFVATWRVDPEAAAASLRFLTPQSVLERYGPPTRVRGEEQGQVRWTYGLGAGLPDAPRDYRVTLSLVDGYVADARVYAP